MRKHNRFKTPIIRPSDLKILFRFLNKLINGHDPLIPIGDIVNGNLLLSFVGVNIIAVILALAVEFHEPV